MHIPLYQPHYSTVLYGDTVPGACQVRVSHCPCVFLVLQYRVKVPGYCARAAFRSVGEVVLLSADCGLHCRPQVPTTTPQTPEAPMLEPVLPGTVTPDLFFTPEAPILAFPNQPRIPNCDQLSLMIRGSIVASVDFVYPLPSPGCQAQHASSYWLAFLSVLLSHPYIP